MDSTAGPLLHNVDLVSLDDDILLDYFRSLFLCEVSECNRITKHIVSSYHRYLLCHGVLFSRHAVCVWCVEIFGSKFPNSDFGADFGRGTIFITHPNLFFFCQGCRFSELGVEDTAEGDHQTLQFSNLSIQVRHRFRL